jgi:hypothetical protein
VIGRYVVLAGRIRQELAEIGRLVGRIERAVLAASRHTAEQDLLLPLGRPLSISGTRARR